MKNKKETSKNNKKKEITQNVFELKDVNSTYNSIPTYKKRKFLSFLSFGNGIDVLLVVLGFIFSFLQGVTMPAFALGLGRIVDSLGSLQSDNGNTTSLNNNALLMFYLGIAIFVFCFIGYFFLGLAGKRMAHKMKVIYFKQILEKDSNYLDVVQISNLTSQFIDNVNSFSSGISEKLNLLFFSVGMILGGIGIGFYVGWLVTIFILCTSPILIIGMKLFLVYLEKSNKLTKESYIEAASISEEAFGLIKIVKAFGGEEHEIKRFSHSLTKHEKISKKYTLIIGSLYGFFFFLILSVYALGFLIGTIVINKDTINDNTGVPYTAGDILTIFFSVLTGGFALGQIGPSVTLFKKALDSFENIDSFLKKMPTIRIDSDAGISPKNLIGEIEFKNVSFSYPSKKDFQVLKNISFKIKKGESAAFVGESGSGKSTIIQLIERFYDPDEGEILIDGKNIKDYNIYKLRSLIGLVSQEPFLFGSNIRNNLKWGLFDDQKINDSELENALEKVNALKFVKKLEKGLDTYVGSGGSKFSGGQKQRISLARAILKNPQILLLDEATSSLDRKNEIEIQKTLNEISKNRTSITIAHRLKTIENSDMIFVMKDGELIENGNHNELLKWKKEYYKFQQIQNIKENVKSKDIKDIYESNIIDDNKIKLESEKEIKNNKNNNKVIEKKIDIKSFLGKEKKLIIIGLLGSILNGGIMPGFGLIFSDILTFLIQFELIKTINIGKTLQELQNQTYLLVLGMFLLAIGAFLFNFASVTVFNYVGEIYTSRLRVNYFKNLIYKDTEFFDNENHKPGSLNNQLQTDCKDINLLISTYIGVIIQGLSTVFIGLIIAFISSWRLTLVNLALLPLLMLGGAADSELQNTNVIEDRENDKQEGASILNETLNNIKIVWSLSSHKKFITIYSKTLEESKNAKIKKSFMTAMFFAFSQFSMFGIYALLFYLGGVFHQRYNESIININRAIFSLIFAGYGAGMANQFIANIGNANRAKKIIEEELNKKNKIEKNPLLLEHKIIKNEGYKNKDLNFKGKIEFKNVYFKYPTRNEMILKDISFIIYPGEKIAFVGHSGCGKSTIIQILLRFYEIESGEILFDDVNIKDIDILKLREFFGIVSQETTLFNGNVKYNIEYNKDYSENEIIESTKKALAYNFIIDKDNLKQNDLNIEKDNEKKIIKMENLPEGFYFDVGNKGEKLSGGQRQRICISRCLIKNPIVYLFDEATSALDNQSEKEIQEAIDNIAKVNTSIIVAHRISTIKNSNKIFVIDNGLLVESGTYDQLIKKKGIFYNLNN